MENEDIIKTKNIDIAPNTYISKDEFIKILTELNFKFIERADIEFITHFKFNAETDEVKPKGFKLNLY